MQRKTPSRRRGAARLIDRLSLDESTGYGVWPDTMERLEKHWNEIERKGCLILKSKSNGSKLVEGIMTNAECLAMFEVLRSVMEAPETDTDRRAYRDYQVATDFIFHKEVMGHETVMIGVCARWNLSETAVKQAVRKYRDDVRERMVSSKSQWKEFRARYISGRLNKSVELLIEETWEADVAATIRRTAEGYRNGSPELAPPRPRRMNRRR